MNDERLVGSFSVLRSSLSVGRLMAHFRPGRIRPLRGEPDPHQFLAMGAAGADGLFVEDFELIVFKPHQLSTAGTGFHLRHRRTPVI